jgi:hypothetical protein
MFKIGCAECHSIFLVDQSDCEDNDVWECPECQSDVECVSYGACPECREQVGFRFDSMSKIVLDIGKAVVLSFIKPVNSINGILYLAGSFMDDIPDGIARGACTICKTNIVSCPRCSTNHAANYDMNSFETTKCHECNIKFREP